MNDGLQASKRTFSDFDFVSCFHDGQEGLDLFVSHLSSKKVDELW